MVITILNLAKHAHQAALHAQVKVAPIVFLAQIMLFYLQVAVANLAIAKVYLFIYFLFT